MLGGRIQGWSTFQVATLERQHQKIGNSKKKFSFFPQRQALSRSSDIFVTNFFAKTHQHAIIFYRKIFCRIKLNFHLLNSPIFGYCPLEQLRLVLNQSNVCRLHLNVSFVTLNGNIDEQGTSQMSAGLRTLFSWKVVSIFLKSKQLFVLRHVRNRREQRVGLKLRNFLCFKPLICQTSLRTQSLVNPPKLRQSSHGDL